MEIIDHLDLVISDLDRSLTRAKATFVKRIAELEARLAKVEDRDR